MSFDKLADADWQQMQANLDRLDQIYPHQEQLASIRQFLKKRDAQVDQLRRQLQQLRQREPDRPVPCHELTEFFEQLLPLL